MTRGALFIHWPGDDARVLPALDRARQSLAIEHPELPHEVVQLPAGSTLLDKSRMLDLSPFDSTVFLDADTVVLGSLDHGFAKAEQHGLAMCICECPWARRFGGLRDRGDIVEYNTGMMFFTRGSAEVFESWKRNIAIDSSIRFMAKSGEAVMPINDQGPFAAAIDETGFNPFVLPMNWNFRPIWHHTAFGPIKVWHDYSPVPDAVLSWNSAQNRPGAIIQCGRFQ